MASTNRGSAVPPKSCEDIRNLAEKIRRLLNIVGGSLHGRFDVVRAIDIYIPSLFSEFEYEIKDVDEMGNHEARTFPDRKVMHIRRDVYEEARKGGRAVFTLAHEIGHLFLHNGVSSYARGEEGLFHPVFCDSEWQADTFAAELLMPFNEVRQCKSIEEVQKRFGVSRAAAKKRLEMVHKKK